MPGATVSENESFSLPSLEHDDVALGKSASPSANASNASNKISVSPAPSPNREQEEVVGSLHHSPMIVGELSKAPPPVREELDRVESVVKRIEMEVGKLEMEVVVEGTSTQAATMVNHEDVVHDLLLQEEVTKVPQVEEKAINVAVDNAGQSGSVTDLPQAPCESGAAKKDNTKTVADAAHEEVPPPAPAAVTAEQKESKDQKTTDDIPDATEDCHDASHPHAIGNKGHRPQVDFEMSAPIVYEARASSTHVVKHLLEVADDDKDKDDLAGETPGDMEIDHIVVSKIPSPRPIFVGPQPFFNADGDRISPFRSDMDEEEEGEKEEEVELRPKKSEATPPPVPKPRSFVCGKSVSNSTDEKSTMANPKEDEKKSFSLPPSMEVDSSSPSCAAKMAEKRLTFSLEASSVSPSAPPKRPKSSCTSSAVVDDGDRIGARQLRGGLRLSSTTSLHIQPDEPSTEVMPGMGEEEEAPLQRRNSIHNVPFVDVNDPGTRERMERYKEERRSMLRAKYKVEDYVTKKAEEKGDSVAETPKKEEKEEEEKAVEQPKQQPKKEEAPKRKKKEKSVSPRPASRVTPPRQSQPVPLRRMPIESPVVKKWSGPARPAATRKAATPSPESTSRRKAATPPRKTSEPPRPTPPTASPRTRTAAAAPAEAKRPSPRTARRSAATSSAGRGSGGSAKAGSGNADDEVNVRQRAAAFGGGVGRGGKEVKTVSHRNNSLNVNSGGSNIRRRSPVSRNSSTPTAAAATNSSSKARSAKKVSADASSSNPNPHPPGSPSKIKNMAAMFEQKS